MELQKNTALFEISPEDQANFAEINALWDKMFAMVIENRERLLIDVMTQVLKKKPEPKDFKGLVLINYPDSYSLNDPMYYDLEYKGIRLGCCTEEYPSDKNMFTASFRFDPDKNYSFHGS